MYVCQFFHCLLQVVGPFYGSWESYCTAKSYVWCEKWDTRQAPDRMTRRAMEQENKKLCEAKKKERNEEVRVGVAQLAQAHSLILLADDLRFYDCLKNVEYKVV